jgi:NADP-dependent 3-hydroxy acid dehydrogenase YdfG
VTIAGYKPAIKLIINESSQTVKRSDAGNTGVICGKYTVLKLAESGYQVFGLARRYDKLATILSSERLSKENKKIFIFQ